MKQKLTTLTDVMAALPERKIGSGRPERATSLGDPARIFHTDFPLAFPR